MIIAYGGASPLPSPGEGETTGVLAPTVERIRTSAAAAGIRPTEESTMTALAATAAALNRSYRTLLDK